LLQFFESRNDFKNNRHCETDLSVEAIRSYETITFSMSEIASGLSSLAMTFSVDHFDFRFMILNYNNSNLNAETQSSQRNRRDFIFAFSFNSLRSLRFKINCLRFHFIEKTDNGFLDTNLTSFGSTRKPVLFGLRVAKRIEKTDVGFLDTPFVSLRATRKPFYLGLRVTKCIENTDLI
jgi:hypothetical protein